LHRLGEIGSGWLLVGVLSVHMGFNLRRFLSRTRITFLIKAISHDYSIHLGLTNFYFVTIFLKLNISLLVGRNVFFRAFKKIK